MTATLVLALRVFAAPDVDGMESLTLVFAAGVNQLLGHYQAPGSARSWSP